VACLVLACLPIARRLFLSLLPLEISAAGLPIDGWLVTAAVVISTSFVIISNATSLCVLLRRDCGGMIRDDPNFVAGNRGGIRLRSLLLGGQVCLTVALSITSLLLLKSASEIEK